MVDRRSKRSGNSDSGVHSQQIHKPIYDATAKILVQGGQAPGIPSVSELQASHQLAENYSDLIKTRPMLERVIDSLSLPYSAELLSRRISVKSPRSLIEIKASDPDPQLASQLANATAQTFTEDFRDRQFTEIAQFQASLGQYSITSDATLITAQAATLSSLSVAEPAIPASSSSSPNTRLNIIFVAILGLLVGGLLAMLIEYLDDRMKSTDDLENLTGLRSMGSITGGLSSMGSILRQRVSKGNFPTIMTDGLAQGPLAESYKYMALNLEFSGLGGGNFKTILITGALPGEGKTTTATNLAVTLARDGKSVVLIDTDLRKPALHTVFGLDNSSGLTSVIMNEASLEDVMSPTPIETLRVITSEPLPPDPTALLRSPRMRALMESLEDKADVVMLDSPPLLLVTDSVLMAAQADSVILVIDAQRARTGTIRRAAKLLSQASTPIVGAVFNKVSVRGGGHYGYGYDYGYDDKSNSNNGVGERVPRVMILRVLRVATNQKAQGSRHKAVAGQMI